MFVVFAHQPYSRVFSTQQLHQETLVCRQYPYKIVMGIGNVFKIDDRYINIDR